jgi:hypothetical protein
MRGSGRIRLLPGRARCLALIFTLGMLPASKALGEEEADLPPWVPSLGIGAGIQARAIDGTIDAFLFDGTLSPNLVSDCIPGGNVFEGFCDMSADESRTLDGGTLGGTLQLLGPSLASLPLHPRPFVHGGFFWNFDSRTIADEGFNPSSFETNFSEPDLRTRLRGNPEYMWYTGGGVALQLPFESRAVFVKVGAHYLEDRVEVVGQVDRGFTVGDTVNTVTNEFTDELTIKGVGPYLGVEAEIARFGPLTLNFVSDVLMTFPLSGTDSQFSIEEPFGGGDPPSCTVSPGALPCVLPAQFSYDADSIHWLGFAGLRFSWIGF